jgi:hypothetical protein
MHAAGRSTVRSSRHILLSGTAIVGAVALIGLAAPEQAHAVVLPCSGSVTSPGTFPLNGAFAGASWSNPGAGNDTLVTVSGTSTFSTPGTLSGSTIGGSSDYVHIYAGAVFTTTGASSLTIGASGGAGNVCVNTAGNLTTDTGSAITIGNAGTGVTTVYNTGTISGQSAIIVSGAGAVHITSFGALTGTSGTGIIAVGSGSGTGQVSVYTGSAGSINATGVGIEAVTSETGGISVVEKGGINGNASNGIIAVDSAITGSIGVTANGAIGSSVKSVGAYGVQAVMGGGNGTITINGSGAIFSTDGGIEAVSSSSGAVLVNFSGNITSTNSFGVLAEDGSTGSVTAKTYGVVHAPGVGVEAVGGSSGAVSAQSHGSVFANIGVLAQSGGAGAASAGNYGYDKASGIGVLSEGLGSGTVSASNSGTIKMTGGIGVFAISQGTGAVTVTNTGTIDPGSVGMQGEITNSASTATLTVNNSGYSYGTAFGTQAFNDGHGATVINNSGTSRGGSQGIRVYSAQGGSITVNNSGSAWGGAGAGVYGNTTGAIIINNSGGGQIFASSGLAIDTFRGATTINNSAVIWGRVVLTPGAVINNQAAGLWQMYGNSSVPASVINNAGDIHLDVGGASTVDITGVTTFNNTGILDLRNGHAGDFLEIGGGVATWNGNAGSTFAFDATLGASPITDEISIGQVNGSTTVLLHDTTPGAAPTLVPLASAPLVVFGDLGGSGTFNMTPYRKGFVDYLLTETAGPNWYLTSVPAANGFEMLKLPMMGQDFWRRTADVWSAREQDVRDSDRQPGWELWAQAFGGQQNDERPFQKFVVNGMTFFPDIGTESAYRGFQMGGDQLTGGHWLWGFTGGFTDQNTEFVGAQQTPGQGPADVHDQVDMTGWNLGGYGGGNWGGFFANGLVKGDFFNADINMLSAGSRRDVTGDSWGAKGELGFRWGGPSLYLEPLGDIDWISTHISSTSMAGASFHWPDSTSSKGELGGRLGGIWGPIQPFVGAYWVDQWSGNNKLNVLFGGGCPSCMNLEDTAPGQYGKVDVGFSIPNWNGLEASMKGAWLFGGDHTSGYAARLTVRWRW